MKYIEFKNYFTKFSDFTLSEYSKRLFKVSSKRNRIDPLFLKSLGTHLSSLSFNQIDINNIQNQLTTHPVIQTAHHLAPTNGLGFFTNDIISCAGLMNSNLHYYLVGCYSAIPMSNIASSGSITFKDFPLENIVDTKSFFYKSEKKSQINRENDLSNERKINLLSKHQKDSLVYNSKVNNENITKFQNLNKCLKSKLPNIANFKNYSNWSLACNNKINNQLFQECKVVYFNINKVVSLYIINVLKTRDVNHPIFKFFTDQKVVQSINNQFNNPVIFMGERLNKKNILKINSIRVNNNFEYYDHFGFQQKNIDNLIEELESDKYAPSLFLTFYILRFLNGLKCLGSFRQIDYLQEFSDDFVCLGNKINKILGITIESENHYDEFSSGSINSKVFSNLLPSLHPFDLFCINYKIQMEDFYNLKMRDFWNPLIKKLYVDHKKTKKNESKDIKKHIQSHS